MIQCIDPELIQEGDLMAYVDGEADSQVSDHVSRCPACAARIAPLRQTSQTLVAILYRAACPPSELLAQYQQGLLPAGDKLKIAAHVHSCSYCTQELSELAEIEDRLTQIVRQLVQGAKQVIETALVTPPRRQPVGVRGHEVAQRLYHAEGIDILIGFQPTTNGKSTKNLVGAVLQAEHLSGGQAWLFAEGEKPISSPVDDLGTFSFQGIAPGKYDLAIQVGEKAVLLREVFVGEQ